MQTMHKTREIRLKYEIIKKLVKSSMKIVYLEKEMRVWA